MNSRLSLLVLYFLCSALAGFDAISTNSTAAVNPPAPPLQIVMCREGSDVEGLIAQFKLKPKFRAPAVKILTTGSAMVGHSYGSLTGTSFAAPHVAGLVALYIAANGRATNAEGVYKIRQAIVDASLPQSQWQPNGYPFHSVTNTTLDPDTNLEPLAIASENWIPKPVITNAGAPGNLQLSFAAVPGYDYTVQSGNDLTPPVAWTNLFTVSASSNVAPFSVTDTNVASQSFYRLQRSPSP
ncbi:MAG: S8 family serine peptidase [Verrucomicrobiota bacterium]